MLWQRVATAAVLIPIVVAGILLLDTATLAVALAAALLIGAQEMAALANVRRPLGQLGFVAAVALSFWVCWQFLLPGHLPPVQWVMVAWWVLITLALVFRRSRLSRIDTPRPAVLLLGGLVLAAAWLSIVALHAAGDHGPRLVLVLFGLIWLADSGAYFAGRAFGKRRLSPHVSPGKTWAGVGGALVATVFGVWLLIALQWIDGAGLLPWVLLGVAVTLVSIGGDLWESRLKREAGIKDSGRLLPGHGGMLDRIDSLLAAAPLYGLGLGLIGVTT